MELAALRPSFVLVGGERLTLERWRGGKYAPSSNIPIEQNSVQGTPH
jgi:hypothetical protein